MAKSAKKSKSVSKKSTGKKKETDKSPASKQLGDLEFVNRLLLSGTERHFETARKLIAANSSNPRQRAAGLQDSVKIWIENDRLRDPHNRNVKKRQYLEALFTEAKAVLHDLNAENKPDDWYARSQVARAFRYAGRFAKARNVYARAIRRMDASSAGIDSNDKAAVIADNAEFWAYLGYTGKAAELLARIPAAYMTGWIRWVSAFLQHQSAFSDLYSFGAAARPHGNIDRYRESNAQLKEVRETIVGKEAVDTFLLEAANWGGIGRSQMLDGADESIWRKSLAKGKEIFEKNFGGDPNVGVNAHWSLAKERRGLMVGRWIQGIDMPGTEAEENAIAEWRRVMRKHYILNLQAAGVPEKASDTAPAEFGDGEPPREDDPGDDDE